jgi:hypothetical protein
MGAKEGLKVLGVSFGALVMFLALIFLLGLFGLGYYKFFGSKEENIRREIFENTQSYVHGKVQDLAKYYDEYNRAESSDSRETIRQLIIVRFAEFDESKIKPAHLRAFLVRMRGY